MSQDAVLGSDQVTLETKVGWGNPQGETCVASVRTWALGMWAVFYRGTRRRGRFLLRGSIFVVRIKSAVQS